MEENKRKNTRSEQVNNVVSFILKENGCVNDSKTMTGEKLYDEYKLQRKDEKPMRKSRFCQKLSVLSQLPSSVSCIKSAEGGNGYYIDLNLCEEDSDTTLKICEEDSDPTFKIKESALYEIVECWLETKNVLVIPNIANCRKGKRWQNVDVLGLAPYNYLGVDYLDVYSVEVKMSMAKWRKNLFEAVSHSMFANYSYFAFMIKASDVDKIDGDLKIYAHNFNVGLLVIAINDKNWDAVTQGSEEISLDGNEKHANARIIEISIAPEHQVSKRIQSDFLEQVLGVKCMGDVYKLFQK